MRASTLCSSLNAQISTFELLQTGSFQTRSKPFSCFIKYFQGWSDNKMWTNYFERRLSSKPWSLLLFLWLLKFISQGLHWNLNSPFLGVSSSWIGNADSIYFLILWLGLWAGKMNQFSRCDWVPVRARWSYLARSGYGLCPTRKVYHLLVFYPI